MQVCVRETAAQHVGLGMASQQTGQVFLIIRCVNRASCKGKQTGALVCLGNSTRIARISFELACAAAAPLPVFLPPGTVFLGPQLKQQGLRV